MGSRGEKAEREKVRPGAKSGYADLWLRRCGGGEEGAGGGRGARIGGGVTGGAERGDPTEEEEEGTLGPRSNRGVAEGRGGRGDL